MGSDIVRSMKGSVLSCAVVALVFGLAGGVAFAQSDADSVVEGESFADALERAENAWVFGDFDEVIEALEPHLLPTAPPIEPRTLIRAYGRLGASAVYAERTDLADAAFLALLQLDSGHELNPLIYPNTVIRYFEQVRETYADQIGDTEPDVAPGETVFVERSVERQPRAVSMAPFGYGFYARGEPGIGTAWLVTELTLGATSLGMYIANETARDSETGAIVRTSTTERRRTVQIITGTGFFVAIAANVLHGALAHRSISSVEYRTLDEPPPEFRGSRMRARVRWSPLPSLTW